jgi:hypothetical protein
MRRVTLLMLIGAACAVAGCGGSTTFITVPEHGVASTTRNAGQKIGFPAVATKNTTRVSGGDPTVDAAGVALAVYPSTGAGTHPQVVTLAPEDDWQASIAASVLMSTPISAPILLSGSNALPSATADALSSLAPTGSGAVGGAAVIRVGDVPKVSGSRTVSISGGGPYGLAAAIDRFYTAAVGKPTSDVVIASGDNAAYAMPAAGWAAESGDPVLFVNSSGVPGPTRQALLAHQHPHIYVLGPPNIIPAGVVKALRKYGPVKRVGGADPAANSVAFAAFRDPPCKFGQPCAHVPGSFGWALRSPGHGYTLINSNRPLDAAASAPLSASGSFGPQLVLDNGNAMPKPILNYFLNFATPGFTQEGPTAAVYNHGWVIGDPSAIAVSVQAEMDTLLEAVPQK